MWHHNGQVVFKKLQKKTPRYALREKKPAQLARKKFTEIRPVN